MARWAATCLVVLAGSLCIEARRDLLTTADAACSGDCVAEYEKCGGKGFATPVSCCNPAHACVKKNAYYAQCVDDDRAQVNVDKHGWDGEVLTCVGASLDCSGACVPRFAKCGGKGLPVAAGCCNPEDSCVRKDAYYAQCLSAERAAFNIASEDWDGEVLVSACAGTLGASGGYGSGTLGASGGYGQRRSLSGAYGTMDDDRMFDAAASRMADEDFMEDIVSGVTDSMMKADDPAAGGGEDASMGNAVGNDASGQTDPVAEVISVNGNTGGSSDGASGPTSTQARTQGEEADDTQVAQTKSASVGLIVGLVAAAVVATVVVGGAVAYKKKAGASAMTAGSAPSSGSMAST